MCLNPAFAAFVLFLPRDAQNRNKIKLFERALLLFQAAINSVQFIRNKIELCHFGLDQTGFYFLPIPKKKFPHSHMRGSISYRGSILTSFCKDKMESTVYYGCLSKADKISQENRQKPFFFLQEHYLQISLRKRKLGWGLECSFNYHSLFW